MSISLSAIESKTTEDNFNFDMSDEEIEEMRMEYEPEPEPIYEPPIEIEEMEVPEMTSEEAEAEEQSLIRKRLILQMYINEFPDKLSNYRSMKSKINSMEIDELELLRKEFEMAVGMKTSINGTMAMGIRGVSLLETLVNTFTPLNASGLAVACNNDQAFQDDLKLVALKYCDYISLSPELRLGMTLTTNIILLDKMNKAKASYMMTEDAQAKMEEAKKKVEEVNNNYYDL
jgi:hypothetical protein